LVFLRQILLAGLFLFRCSSLSAQLTDYDKDTLEQFFKKSDWKSYFGKLKVSGDSAIQKSDPQFALQQLEFYLLRIQPGRDLALKFMLRKAYTQQASKYRKTGDFQTALNWYLRAHNMVEDAFCLDDWAWYVENEIANIYTRFDDFEKAEYYGKMCEQSLIYYGNKERLSRLYTNLGIMFYSKSDLNKAAEYYKKSIFLATVVKNDLGFLASSIGLARIYILQGKSSEALNELQLAEVVCDRLDKSGKNYWESILELYWSKAKVFEIQNDSINAIAEYQCVEEILPHAFIGSHRRELSKLYFEIANFYFKRNDDSHCELYLSLGIKELISDSRHVNEIPFLESLFPENTLNDLFSLAADYFHKKFIETNNSSFLKKSIAYLNASMIVYEKKRSSLLAAPSKLMNIGFNKSIVDRCISYLWELNQLNPADGNLDLLRNCFNTSKALLLNEKTEELIQYEGMSELDKTKLEKLEEQELNLRMLTVDIKNKDSINVELIRIQSEIQLVFSKYPRSKSNYFYPEHYIEYNVQDSFVFVFAKINGRQYFKKIGRATDLKRICKDLNYQILHYQHSIDEAVLKNASSFLLGFYTDILPTKVCIIPDGIIQFVPFEVLKDSEGNYLGEKHIFSYSFSCRQRASNDKFPSKSIFIYAIQPEYHGNNIENQIANRGNIMPLQYTSLEIKALQELFGDKVMISKQIDKSGLFQQMNSAEIVHFSGHAKVAGDSAYLYLSNETKVKFQEIQAIRNPLRLVVLSACETGLGTWEQGEGIRSLGKTFRESGAEAVIMSLWAVNDESTARIISSFYGYLKKGQTKDESLQSAKTDYIQNASFEKRHPYYWAGFVAIGDMSALRRDSNSRLILLLAVGIFIFLISNLIYNKNIKN
jgi:tetratricopeptide (TPR) repeat protein